MTDRTTVRHLENVAGAINEMLSARGCTQRVVLEYNGIALQRAGESGVSMVGYGTKGEQHRMLSAARDILEASCR